MGYAVQIIGANAFTITVGARTERFENYTKAHGGDFVSMGPARMWTWAGRKKLDALGIFPAVHGRAAPRVNSFIAKALKQAKGQNRS